MQPVSQTRYIDEISSLPPDYVERFEKIIEKIKKPSIFSPQLRKLTQKERDDARCYARICKEIAHTQKKRNKNRYPKPDHRKHPRQRKALAAEALRKFYARADFDIPDDQPNTLILHNRMELDVSTIIIIEKTP